MPLPKTLASYSDVKRIADSVITQQSAATIRFAKHGEAVRWRSRFYMYRKLLIEAEVARGRNPSSPYDSLVLRLAPRGTEIRIEFLDSESPEISFDSPGAKVLPLESPPLVEQDSSFVEDDELFIQALNISKNLDK